MAEKPTLAYWNIRGLGNAARILLAHLEVDFENKLYDPSNREVYEADKQSLGFRFPNLPYFIDGDFKLCESQAILQYICAKYRKEYLGTTLEEQARAWEVSCFFDDKQQKVFSKVAAMTSSEEARNAAFEELRNMLTRLQNCLQDKQFLVMNDRPTWIDFRLLEWVSYLKHFDGDIIAREFPRLDQFRNDFLAYGNVQQAYDQFKHLYYFSPSIPLTAIDS